MKLKIKRKLSLAMGVLSAIVLVASTSANIAVAARAQDVDAQQHNTTLWQDVNHIRDIGTIGVLAEFTDETSGATHTDRARAGEMIRNTGLPVAWGSHFRIGSTTKTFVSTVILQLEAEGKLSLNDTVEMWLPGVVQGNGNDGNIITIRQLLQHTSGLVDFVGDDDFLSTIATPEAFYANQNRTYTPQQLVSIAVANPPSFQPGTSWEYSNTNYVLAGMVIKAATGKSWNEEVKNRIITPLGLTETKEPGTNPHLPLPSPRGYELFDDSGQYYDTTEHNMTWIDAAGSIISTPSDVNKFLRALMKGQLLPPEQMTALKTTVPVPHYESIWPGAAYGLGIMKTDLPCGGEYWHHGGDVIGYSDTNGVTPDGLKSAMVASSTNTLGDPEFASGSIQYTNELVWNALCGYDTDPASSPFATTRQQKQLNMPWLPKHTLPALQQR